MTKTVHPVNSRCTKIGTVAIRDTYQATHLLVFRLKELITPSRVRQVSNLIMWTLARACQSTLPSLSTPPYEIPVMMQDPSYKGGWGGGRNV
jgi:hypothetical protein